MKKDTLSFEDDSIVIKPGGIDPEQSKLHIYKIEVFTGDDEYHETDCIEIEASGAKLFIKKFLEYCEESPHRLRSEPGARIYLASESGMKFYLSIAHHKGCVKFNIFEWVPQCDAERWDKIL